MFTKAAALLLLIGKALAGPALTEETILAQGLKDSVFQAQVAAPVTQAELALQSAGRWDNPSAEYSRETLDLPNGSSEETSIWVAQRFNIAGVKGLETKAAKASLASAQAQMQLAKRDWQRSLRQRFYALLASMHKVDAFNKQAAQLRSVSSSVSKRVAQGDASQFDLLRIDQQVTLVLSDISAAQADTQKQQLMLFGMLGMQPQPVTGALLPDQNLLTPYDLSDHPRVTALEAKKQALLLQAKAADRSRWPELTLGVGHKQVNEPDLDSDGNMIAIGIDIPLFTPSNAQQQLALSQANQMQAELNARQRELHAHHDAVMTQYQTLKSTAASLTALTAQTDHSLSQLAEASYQAGELGVMELLDAYQADLETRLRYINAAMAARRAYIELQHIRGD